MGIFLGKVLLLVKEAKSGKIMKATPNQAWFKFIVTFIQDGNIWVKELREKI